MERLRGEVEGTVNGEMFSFSITGQGGGIVRAEMTVDGEGMRGQLTGLLQGPVELHLRRSGGAPLSPQIQ